MDIATKITGWVYLITGLYLQNDELCNLGGYLADHGAALMGH